MALQKFEYQNLSVFGKAKDASPGDAMRRGYVDHELKPQRSEAQQSGVIFPKER